MQYDRFIKRDTNTGVWEEVGDDTAREKASQVLRDAVAFLPEIEGESSATVAASSYERKAPPASQETPTLESVSAMMHPGSQQRSSKRRRYTQPSTMEPSPEHISSTGTTDRYSSQVAYSPMMHPLSAHSSLPPAPQQRHHHHHSHRLRSASSHRGRTVQDPTRYASVARAPEIPSSHINEFDLLHGELLESDPEDQEPLPPGSERDWGF